MPDIVDFPGGLFISDRSDPQLVSATRSGGMAINGFEQIISPLSRRWRWSPTIPVLTASHARAMRAFLAAAEGRFNYIRIRVCDQYRMSRREMGADPEIGGLPGVPHSDGALFSDGTGYAYSQGATTPTGVVAVDSTSILVDPGFRVIPGVFFSIDDWLYVVKKVDDPEEGESETLRRIHFSPPLRNAADDESEINWDAESLWRLATDEEGQTWLRSGRFSDGVTINLVEPVGR